MTEIRSVVDVAQGCASAFARAALVCLSCLDGAQTLQRASAALSSGAKDAHSSLAGADEGAAAMTGGA